MEASPSGAGSSSIDSIEVRPGTIGGHEGLTVDGRGLHAFLGNRDHFAMWVKHRISQYDFVENRDFTSFSENTEKGRPTKE